MNSILREPTRVQLENQRGQQRMVWDSSVIFSYDDPSVPPTRYPDQLCLTMCCREMAKDTRARMVEAKAAVRRNLHVLNPTMQKILELCCRTFRDAPLLDLSDLRSLSRHKHFWNIIRVDSDSRFSRATVVTDKSVTIVVVFFGYQAISI